MEVVRHFLGFAEDSDARAAERCVGAVVRRQVPGVARWPQGCGGPPGDGGNGTHGRASAPER